jgi:hypothetical protein
VLPGLPDKDGQVCPLVDGRFILEGSFHPFKGCHAYLPMAHRELPGELATVATGKEANVLDFARRYGLLGYGQAGRLEELIGARMREGEHAKGDPPLRGDPLSWIVAHAQTVRLALGPPGAS